MLENRKTMRTLLLCLSIIYYQIGVAQSQPDSLAFPASWAGNWKGNRILCTYEKTDANTMVFEVFSGSEKEISSTGNTKQGEEEIPAVKTYPFGVFQRAVLRR